MGSTRSDVLAARAGDAAAFARLVHHTAPTVCAITTAILGNPIAGEEVGQEVFVCAWQGLGALRDPDQFEAWIRGIARNRARDALRSRLQRREVTGDALTQLADPAPDPADTLDGAEREAAVWAALDALDVEDREVLILYYREGQSVDEVARRLALTGPAVRKRMSRARARLRDDVADRLGPAAERTAPRAAFATAVATAIAVAAPLPARAAVGYGVVALAAAVALTLGIVGGYAGVRSDLPPIAASPTLATVERPTPPGRRSDAEPSRAPDPVPDHVMRAFLAAEDARFFAHGAVDVRALGRAVVHDAAGGALQGGSTLTQQLAKSMLVDRMPTPSVRRKLYELVLAFELERSLSKDQILARYLDGVYLGAGAWGLAEASRLYFDVPVSELTVAEAALLGGIPANPKANGPYDDPAGATARRAQVLDRMVANGWLTPEDAAIANATPLPTRDGPR